MKPVSVLFDEYPRNDTFLLFWRGPLSQWWQSSFIIEDVTYNCAEQYMMAAKARLFDDVDAEQKIMGYAGKALSQAEFIHFPRYYQRIGRQVKNFNPTIWNNVCKDLVLRGNLAKFSQDPVLLKGLLSTNDLHLVEASPVDTVWGIGLAETDDNAFEPKSWRGTNYLGQVLNETKQILKSNPQ